MRNFFAFLFKARGLEQQRQACMARVEQAATNHELASVICQATAESLQTSLDINRHVRKSTRTGIEKMTKDVGSGENGVVKIEPPSACDGNDAEKRCAKCAFFRRTAEGVGACDHIRVQNAVVDVFFCDYWTKK